jgi:hypothetical protein
MARWHSANVLQTTPGGRQLWRFNANGTAFVFAEEQKLSINEQIPADLVAKDWRSLLRNKLNVAWLPADKVFLRAVQLPSSDLNEIRSMVELQIEKLSPLPVTQIVWSIQVLPNTSAPVASAEGANAEAAPAVPLQTVIVIIAARSYVEEFLGELESHGFLADRLEVPGLEQLVATKATGNGVWVYANGPTEPLLIAWWFGGMLHNLAMVSLPETPDRAELLKNQIEQMAWAGELEGWLTEPPKIHLVATPEQAHLWEPLLRSTAESEIASPTGTAAAPIEVIPALKPADAAAKVAEASAGEGSTTNLLPDEYARRYRQQFIDGLWMRALFGALMLYGVAVIVYFAVVFVLNVQATKVTSQVRDLGNSYTNALRDEAQLQILKDRQELKYAALDCWKAVADGLGESTAITIDDMFFQRGKLELRGSVPADQQIQITDFNDKMRSYKIGNAPLFTEINPPAVTIRGDRADWRFSCMMKGAETR